MTLPGIQTHCSLGCSLYLKNYLNFMDIKSRPSFTVRRRMVVELMVVIIGRVMLNLKLKSLIYHHIYYVRANCRSDPVILTFGRKSYKCGICGETGHTRKRCILGNSNDPVSKKLLYYLEGVGVPCPETEDDDDEEDLETQVCIA